jgi:hypothetical protein
MTRKPSQWIKDRNRLRKELREGKRGGSMATMLCCLVSHMRGKQHMKSYKKLAGGWGNSGGTRTSVPAEERKLVQMYGDDALTYLNGSRVDNLDDQKKWIKKHEYLLHAFPALDREGWEALRQRVLVNDYAEPEVPADMPTGALAPQTA